MSAKKTGMAVRMISFLTSRGSLHSTQLNSPISRPFHLFQIEGAKSSHLKVTTLGLGQLTALYTPLPTSLYPLPLPVAPPLCCVRGIR